MFSRSTVEGPVASGLPARNLQRASGAFDGLARLTIVMHYPTFNCSREPFGPTADKSSPCTSLVMKKGLDPVYGETTMLDSWNRRETTKGRTPQKRSFDEYINDSESSIQNEFAETCILLSVAKVELYTGRAVQRWAKSRFGSYVSFLRLTYGSSKVDVTLVWNRGQLKKIAVDCPHPEVGFHPGAAEMGRRIDAAIGLAAGLARIRTPLLEGCFEWKRGRMPDYGVRTSTDIPAKARNKRFLCSVSGCTREFADLTTMRSHGRGYLISVLITEQEKQYIKLIMVIARKAAERGRTRERKQEEAKLMRNFAKKAVKRGRAREHEQKEVPKIHHSKTNQTRGEDKRGPLCLRRLPKNIFEDWQHAVALLEYAYPTLQFRHTSLSLWSHL